MNQNLYTKIIKLNIFIDAIAITDSDIICAFLFVQHNSD